MALSDQLATMSVRAKDAETHAAAARDQARADLERDVAEARAADQEQAEKLRQAVEAGKERISGDWAKLQQSWNEHIATARSNVESKKAELDAAHAERHAEHAEEDALFAVDYACAAIEGAESAALYAVLARKEADELAAGAGARA